MGKEIGYSGTEIFSGIISNDDYNPKLSFPNSIDVYEQMRKGDGTVKSLLRAVKLPIINGVYFVTAASQSAKDIEIAKFVETQFFKKLVWTDFIKGVLIAFDFGFIVFEKIFERIENRIFYKKFA